VRTPGRIRRHVSRLRSSISTPSDAWLLARILGWSLVLPIAKHALPLPRLLRLMRPRKRTTQRDRKREVAIVSLAAWVFKTRPPRARDNCLERGLVVYRYLSRAGAGPELVIGAAKGVQGVHGHVWVTIDGRAVHDSPATLAGFEPILVVKSDGSLIGTPPPRGASFSHQYSASDPRLRA
jgi:Transglutaminase-like superfamily